MKPKVQSAVTAILLVLICLAGIGWWWDRSNYVTPWQTSVPDPFASPEPGLPTWVEEQVEPLRNARALRLERKKLAENFRNLELANRWIAFEGKNYEPKFSAFSGIFYFTENLEIEKLVTSEGTVPFANGWTFHKANSKFYLSGDGEEFRVGLVDCGRGWFEGISPEISAEKTILQTATNPGPFSSTPNPVSPSLTLNFVVKKKGWEPQN